MILGKMGEKNHSATNNMIYFRLKGTLARLAAAPLSHFYF